MSRRPRLAPFGSALAFATLAAAQPAQPGGECPRPAGTDYAVKALRFSDGRSYAFVVTNRGSRPIRSVAIGWGGPPFIDRSVKTRPTSMGSPTGWRGAPLYHPDPRLPESHSPVLVRYYWEVEDGSASIQPGRSLSGFSVQLPTPREMELAYLRDRESWGLSAEASDLPKDPSINDRLPPQPDLTRVSFVIGDHGRGCGTIVGTVVPDRRAGDGDGTHSAASHPQAGP